MTITYKRLLIAAILVASAIVPVARVDAQRIHISIGDRPYYTRGPYYWDNDVRYVWVPGYYSHRRGYWVRGHYEARERRTPLQRLHRKHRKHRKLLFNR